MIRREASINDVRIAERDRRIFGPRASADRDQHLPVS
jgi:nuclear transport factor 2 (NTF2) superfamily protein